MSLLEQLRKLLPALNVAKKYVVEKGLCTIDLYGRSAGAGALVNLIAVLNTSSYEEELKQIGITSKEKNRFYRLFKAVSSSWMCH